VQKSDWKDVILRDEFKKALQKDVFGFFKSEAIYKELAIPWKVCMQYLELRIPL
jgi:transitional endoplasmic reticulum ATPase